MRFRLVQRFSAPIGEVEAAFFDPELLLRLDGRPYLARPKLLDQVDQGEIVRQRVRHRWIGPLSPTVTAVINPARLSWVHESVLDRRSHHTRFRIHPDHYADRLRCRGIVLVREAEGWTVRVTEGELKVTTPLYRTSVEQAIVRGLRRYAVAEAVIVQKWLDERRAT